MTSNMKIPQLYIYNDSQLILNQLSDIYKVKKEHLLSYHQYSTFLLKRFDQVFLNHIPKEENHMANVFANLAITMTLRENETTKVYVCHQWVIFGFVYI